MRSELNHIANVLQNHQGADNLPVAVLSRFVSLFREKN